MKLREFDIIGKKTPSFQEVLRKHRVPYNQLAHQLRKGIKVEKEHTGDLDLAKEIALDHLNEFPDYYDRLEKAEKK